MSFYLTTMFALPFKHLIDGGSAPFPNVPPPDHTRDDAGTPLLLAKILCTVLEGKGIVTLRLRSSLNSRADPLYMTNINAGLGRKPFGLAGYRYDMIDVIGRVRSTVRQLLCNGAPPGPLAQERPTTTPTRWYCHKCQTGPYSISAQTSCTNVINGRQCDHPMCYYCKKE